MKESTRLEKLLSEPFEPEGQFISLKKSEETIAALLEGLVKYTAKVVFKIGRELTLIRQNLEYGEFSAWLDKKFPFSRKTAYNYMSFYERLSCVNFTQVEGLTMTEALAAAGIIEPKRPRLENAAGLNRIDLGGDPGQMKFDFAELFELPASANTSLQNYRTFADLLTEIIVVKRTADGELINKRIACFCEDVPQNSVLRTAYKTMAMETQAAIEKYLAAVEKEEA